MSNIINCRNCQKIFRSLNGKDHCPDCSQAFVDLYTLVQQNPNKSVEEIAVMGNVTPYYLERLLHAGRLGSAASHIITKCHKCGKEVAQNDRKGWFCSHCGSDIEMENMIAKAQANKFAPILEAADLKTPQPAEPATKRALPKAKPKPAEEQAPLPDQTPAPFSFKRAAGTEN